MGRVAAVTYEHVAIAAEQLKAEGLTPTAKLVRSRLGDVGSLGTIQRHLMEWRLGKGEPQQVARMLPPEMQRAVFKFVDEEVSRINGELTQQVERQSREMADLAADNEEHTRLVRQLRAELAEQAKLRDNQDGQLTRLLDELKAARDEIALQRRETELARLDLTRMQSRLEAQAPLEGELRQHRADFEAEHEARVRAERDAAVLQAQKDILEARVEELKEAASTQPPVHGARSEERIGKKPERSPQTPTRRGKKVEGSGEPGIRSPEHASGAVPPEVGEPGDPRQPKLC